MPWNRKIKKKGKSKKRTALFLFILVPPVVYVVHMLLLFILDSVWGDGLMLYHYQNDPPGVFQRLIVTDGWRAVPVFYLTSLLLWVELRWVSSLLRLRGMVSAIVLGAVTGWFLAFLLIGKSAAVVIPYTVSGLLMAAVLGRAANPQPATRKRR